MSRVHFILDEAASLGQMDVIDDALGLGRGYGIRLQFYFQSLGQLKECFPNGQDQTLLSNTSQIYFGVNDQQTADLVSARLGDETIVVVSGGTSRGKTHTWSDGPQRNVSDAWSTTTNNNWQQQARRLLKPEEVIALPPRMAITFTPGTAPIATCLLRFYEEKKPFSRPGWLGRQWKAFMTLVASVILCLVTLVIAAGLTLMIDQKTRSSPAHRPYRPAPGNIFNEGDPDVGPTEKNVFRNHRQD
jgi:type IV secretion system protein VirD4